MLAQLKTVVLIEEAAQLAFFRLVEYLEDQNLWVRLQAQNGQKQRTFFWNVSLFLLKISYNAVYYSLHRTAHTDSYQKRMRSGRPRGTTEQEDKYIRVSSLRNRPLASPQLAASLHSSCKTPNSTSTVKRRLWHDGLLGRGPLSSVCVLLPILIFYFNWPVWDMAFSMQLYLEGQHPGVASSLLTLRQVFCGYYVMKLLCVCVVYRSILCVDTRLCYGCNTLKTDGFTLYLALWIMPSMV